MAHEMTLPSTGMSPDLRTGSIVFLGTATVLIRYAGFTILTDPNFIHRHEQVDLGYGVSATRQTNPALEIHELPSLDLVLLSHFHGDHFDQVAERELDKSLPIVTTPEAAEALRQRGFVALHPLATWAHVTVSKGDVRLRITATPGRHGPPVVSLALPEVMGSILEFQSRASDRASECTLPGTHWLSTTYRRSHGAIPRLILRCCIWVGRKSLESCSRWMRSKGYRCCKS
jgi:hypothetical protein